jgi:hypothetical protein
MKYSIICLLFFVFLSCKNEKQDENSTENTTTQEEANLKNDDINAEQSFFGEEFDQSEPVMASAAFEKYQNMKPGDTVVTTFTSSVNSVCEKKGCWMRLKLTDEEESLVTFKDYGFFVPKDIQGQDAVVHGKLFVKETSVEELKHFAEDAGKSDEEIASITKPKLVYAFEADGVYLK